MEGVAHTEGIVGAGGYRADWAGRCRAIVGCASDVNWDVGRRSEWVGRVGGGAGRRALNGMGRTGWGAGGWRRDLHEEEHRLAGKRFRIDERDQDQGQEDGGVEGKCGEHPAAAAGTDSAGGFEGGVFKHGLPPWEPVAPQRERTRRWAGRWARG